MFFFIYTLVFYKYFPMIKYLLIKKKNNFPWKTPFLNLTHSPNLAMHYN